MPPKMKIRVVRNRIQKWCTKCSTWKDLKTEYYTRKSRRPGVRLPRPECKRCSNRMSYEPKDGRKNRGLVSMQEMNKHLRFLIDRLGQNEAARRLGMHPNSLWKMRTGKTYYMRRHTAAAILALAREVNAAGERRTYAEKRHNKELRQRRHDERVHATAYAGDDGTTEDTSNGRLLRGADGNGIGDAHRHQGNGGDPVGIGNPRAISCGVGVPDTDS